MTHKNVKIVCSVSIILFLLLRCLGVDISDAVGYAVSAAACFYYLYDRFLWRFNPLDQTPRLFGKYAAIFHSNFNGGTKHESTITIKQNLSYIYIYEECVDGYSESITASLVKSAPHGQWHLYYTYLTHPKQVKQQQNDDPHHGTAILCIKDRNTLEGPYFTNRINPTGGDLNLKRMSK